MRGEDVDFWWRAHPFVPFRITMNSGRYFDVRHPEMMHLFRSSFLHYFEPSEGGEVSERAHMVGLSLIEKIEPLDQAAPDPRQSDAPAKD